MPRLAQPDLQPTANLGGVSPLSKNSHVARRCRCPDMLGGSSRIRPESAQLGWNSIGASWTPTTQKRRCQCQRLSNLSHALQVFFAVAAGDVQVLTPGFAYRIRQSALGRVLTENEAKGEQVESTKTAEPLSK